jgi:hypothetical protein
MRVICPLLGLLFSACGPAPQPPARVQADPAADASYGKAVQQLATLDQEARDEFTKGQPDRAAALIQSGEPISKRLMSVPRPTLEATEAASDLDRLYGDMLFSNRNYGWARLMFQKNLARWKHWTPQTEESARRVKQAESAIAECDRRIEEAATR